MAGKIHLLWVILHKIVRPDLRNLSFPSSNFAEDYKGKEGRTQQCMNSGEAASTITIFVDIGHLFKKIFKGFNANILTWLSYDEAEDKELVPLVKFWFESGCSDETTVVIFSCINHQGPLMVCTGSFFSNWTVTWCIR